MLTAVFNSTRAVTPITNIDTFGLGYTITDNAQLKARTEAVRAAADPGPLKLRLPGATLGGIFKPLPPHYNHGKCRGQCATTGYRNTQHIDWDARTGVVLIDMDDIQSPVNPDVVKALCFASPPRLFPSRGPARGARG